MRKDSLLNNKMPDTSLLRDSYRLVLYAPFILALAIVLASATYVSGEVTTYFAEMLMVSMFISGASYGLMAIVTRREERKRAKNK